MATRNLLYKKEYVINDFISVSIPSVGDILDCEDDYYNMVTILTAMPIDMMVQLDDIGVDFTAINEYELFLLMFNSLQGRDTSLIFNDLDLNLFHAAVNKQNDTIVLVNEHTGAKIDRAIHGQISDILRKMHQIKKNNRRPANTEAKEFMLKRARDKMRKRNNRSVDSELESLIVAMVNTEQFHYGFDDVRQLSIYQFNESVRQVISKIDYDNRMHGVYAGTVSAKDLSQDDLNWLIHK